MTFTLKGLSKNGKQAIYTGATQNLRFPVGAFEGKVAPQTITDLSVFAAPVVKPPKVKMTPEERKAARAAKPKPTLAEKVAAAQKRAAALQAKLEASAAEL